MTIKITNLATELAKANQSYSNKTIKGKFKETTYEILEIGYLPASNDAATIIVHVKGNDGVIEAFPLGFINHYFDIQ